MQNDVIFHTSVVASSSHASKSSSSLQKTETCLRYQSNFFGASRRACEYDLRMYNTVAKLGTVNQYSHSQNKPCLFFFNFKNLPLGCITTRILFLKQCSPPWVQYSSVAQESTKWLTSCVRLWIIDDFYAHIYNSQNPSLRTKEHT